MSSRLALAADKKDVGGGGGGGLLVHCNVGQSRSARFLICTTLSMPAIIYLLCGGCSMVIHYIMKSQNRTLLDAWSMVRKIKKGVLSSSLPNPSSSLFFDLSFLPS